MTAIAAPADEAPVEVDEAPDPTDPQVIAERLAQVAAYTETIREHQDRADTAAAERKTLVRELRSGNVTFKRIADAMGTTEASVYKLVRARPNTPPT